MMRNEEWQMVKEQEYVCGVCTQRASENPKVWKKRRKEKTSHTQRE